MDAAWTDEQKEGWIRLSDRRTISPRLPAIRQAGRYYPALPLTSLTFKKGVLMLLMECQCPCIGKVNDMLSKTHVGICALGIFLAFIAANVDGQETVYKWVDEDGVVHFSAEPPDESKADEFEKLTTAKAPLNVPPAQPAIKSPATSETDSQPQSEQPKIELPALVEKTDTTTMSLAELDRRCEDAREKMIAPLREAEITKCKQDKKNDPAWCDRFNADYGDGGRTLSGTIRPRMFNDLPECIEAEQALHEGRQ